MKTPNLNLDRLHREAGWTQRQFALSVNRIGAERGMHLKYKEPSVNQWLKGHLPRESVRLIVLEALARRLNRAVSHIEAGFPAPAAPATSEMGIVQELVELGRLDMDAARRSVLGAGIFSTAMMIPNWHDAVERITAAESGRVRRIGNGEIAMVVAMTQQFSDLDYQFGGRDTRPTAAAFIVNTIAPYLTAEGSDSVRGKMLSAASDLCYLTGYMAVDEGQQNLGQRYYLKAMELARASGDRNAYSLALHGMSSQALQLGHSRTALRLTSAAMNEGKSIESNLRAFLAGQRAYASALTGDQRSALAFLREAETEIGRTNASSRVVMGHYRDAVLEYDIAQVKYGLGDTAGSVRSLKRYASLQNKRHRRRAVLDGATLAERQMSMGHLEAACATWSQVMDDYPFVQSGRADQRINSMRRSLKPFLTNPAAQALHERAREMLQRGVPRKDV
ncbi:tetratricopeptide repeat protein [Streptomyces sp. NPDC004610]|uniref:tetratricopeptide repeat protein n=1 Tax=unclassified Streptomyces TaxID=2593676 RepID=UPI0033B0C173